MGTTAKNQIPYVDPSNLLVNFPTSDKAQADRLDALLTPIHAIYYLTTDIPIPAATDVPVVFQTASISDPVNLPYANGMFTVKVAGLYLITASIFYDRPATGTPRVYHNLYQNGASVAQQISTMGSTWNYSTLPLVTMKRAAVNDTFYTVARCDSVTTAKANSSGFQTSMSMVRLGSY